MFDKITRLSSVQLGHVRDYNVLSNMSLLYRILFGFLWLSVCDVASLAIAEPLQEPRPRNPALDQAVALIREHQHPVGFWYTLHTPGLAYEHQTEEVNSYLTAIMVDLLKPIAADVGLESVVEKAKAFVHGQIEDDGLVRYLGRPGRRDAPPPPCRITPDSDDTALAWRIAPLDDESLLSAVLGTLTGYRTQQGLYKTWLAAPSDYQCLNLGDDPNPVDVGIQMNLLLFFAKYAPQQAGELCSVLKETINQDPIWVYYDLAPLLPMLREPDLEEVQCPVRVPRRRLEEVPSGQAIWMDVGRSLRDSQSEAASKPSKASIEELLHRLSRNSFEMVKASPPLLYHNDRRASVQRYYWSPDVGYVIWLRLFFLNAMLLQ